ncbi:radical SAM/SPASM domain-containing protein [Maridesulfovibrio sp.]|uniref:radical SAM/SPASM domain-containing protein n=1 Tax=Maridesulfovibrio sp. TaxID=2795000 RepID=UPI0039F013D8
MSHADSITLLNLEFNSSCNLRCKWCSLDHGKERKVMPREVLEKVMEEVGSGVFKNLRRIDLHNGGETLLHPDLPGMLSVIRRHRPSIPSSVTIGLLTNGMLLTPKVSEQICRSRAVTQVRFSIDGGSPAAFEYIRKGAKWDVVRRNVQSFMEINRRSKVPVQTEIICMIPAEGVPDNKLDPDFAALLQLADKVSVRNPHNWDGSVDLGVDDSGYRVIAEQRLGEVCFLLQKNLVVLPDGKVTVCCNDLNERGVFGSVLENTLGELAAHPVRQAMIRAFKEGRKDEIELCRGCTGFYAPNPGGK